jgi:hypothetical protein
MHTTENTNAVVKIGRSMCVTCLFGVQTVSLLSTRHVFSFQSVAIEVHNHKHTGPRQTRSSNANNWNGLVQQFKFLMISMMREIWLETWLTIYGLRVWMGKSNDWKGLILQDYNEMIKNLMLGISMVRV